jgi:hypothetical protein
MTTHGTNHESNRLRPKENDWNLVGGGSPAKSRTRATGKRQEPTRRTQLSSSSSDDEREEEEEKEEDSADEEAMLKLRKEKPPHK